MRSLLDEKFARAVTQGAKDTSPHHDPFLSRFLFACAGSMQFAFDGHTLYIRLSVSSGTRQGSMSWDHHLKRRAADTQKRRAKKRAAQRAQQASSNEASA